jgi:hypothetical protein
MKSGRDADVMPTAALDPTQTFHGNVETVMEWKAACTATAAGDPAAILPARREICYIWCRPEPLAGGLHETISRSPSVIPASLLARANKVIE